MNGTASYLLEFLEGSRKRFIIPVYQRNYDWKKENCQQLFDDLVNLIRENKKTHFFGSIVSSAQSREEVVLIDGQQRITTVSLIMIAMMNAMKKGLLAPEDSRLCAIIESTYIIDKNRPDEQKVRLKPFRNDSDAFERLIFKDESEYVEDSKITINYRYFYDRILNKKELTADELFRAIDSLEIIDIELEPQHGDDAQLIFESLNSTGLDLTEADKIRNFVLMNHPTKIQDRFYDDYWSKIERLTKEELDGFVRNYLTIKEGVIPTLKGIYKSFKAYAKKEGDIEVILQDMLRYAYAYDKIVNSKVGNADTNEIAKRLDLLDMTVAYPFLMAFMVYADETQLDEKEIYKVFSCVETFIFRRLMCDLPTNALNKIFATLHSSVIKNMKDNPETSYSSVMIYILESKKQSASFPKNEEFLIGFTTKNIYSMRGKNKQYLFERLENGKSKETNDVVKGIEEGKYTIEHIMPQTLSSAWKQALGENYEEIHERWLHTISNLTLSAYNSNYSNKTFQEKKTMENGFLESGFRLNRFISQFDKWGEEELELRKAELSKKALEIWGYPVSTFVPKVKEDDIVYLSDDAATYRDIQYYVFRGERGEVPTWSEMMWEVVSKLYEINPSILYQQATGGNVWFGTIQHSKNYRKLAEGLYYCPTSSSTENKMSILRNLFRLYGIEEDDLFFGLQPKKEKEEIAVPVRNVEGNRTWLIPSNESKFRLQDWIETHDYIHWHQGVKYRKGDDVYVYSSAPTSAIVAKFVVEEPDIENYDDSEEVPYRVNPTYIKEKVAKFVNLQKPSNPSLLELNLLKEHGLSAPPQGPSTLSGDILEYIEKVF